MIDTVNITDLFGNTIKVVSKRKTRRKQAQKSKANLRQTKLRVLHLGAGVQSSTIAEMIVTGEYPRVDLVLFADTGDEPDYVYKQVDYLRERLQTVGIPLHVVRRPGRGLIDSVLNGDSKFISMPLYTKNLATGKIAIIRRQCTNEYKIIPCDNFVLDWLISHDYAFLSKGEHPRRIVRQNVLVEYIYGISYEEFYRAGHRGPQWQKSIYPLIAQELTANQCIQWLKDHGLPVPRKSSCIRCPFHSDEYWLDLQQNNPVEFYRTCDIDDWLRSPEGKRRFKGAMKADVYIHPSCQPLRTIDFAARIKERTNTPMFGDDPLCGNHCRL
jgi:hypothetical protein